MHTCFPQNVNTYESITNKIDQINFKTTKFATVID